ncbi:arsenate reductase [Carnobacterium iners]|uniref:Arsenate reductase n=1 Tax=Carnobacterium iners TaxID=1073423 RepID=A0A1X7MPQ2_9LACT|nr:arsenate reductase family protein [Carnobacterium iners]SEK94329.1 arsenate reductase [Carnobacterium iners]SMH26675.1 arsenate reductase [Carnobacterium iners]
MLNFYEHKLCSTCRKGRKWLKNNAIEFQTIDMIAQPPSKEQLIAWMTASDLPVSRFFNGKGNRYRELNLKDHLSDMTIEAAAEILSTDGMLIKRPLITDGSKITLGFNEEDFEKEWLK